jgi:hypothetical protein
MTGAFQAAASQRHDSISGALSAIALSTPYFKHVVPATDYDAQRREGQEGRACRSGGFH